MASEVAIRNRAIDTEDYCKRVGLSHQSLGISTEYAERSGLNAQFEAVTLVDTELDFYGRPQKLTPSAFQAWSEMREAATNAGCSLFLISAFRGLEYQHQLIVKKLSKGQSIEEILSVNAAPGYSEHHTGRALDVGTLGCDALVEEFENTKTFQWLNSHAGEYGFTLSFPKGNRHGLGYEPWHWCFHEENQ